MKFLQVMLLLGILLMLCSIRVGMEKWGNELVVTKVTEVKHVYNYQVDSYGVVKLNDKLIGVVYK